MGMWCSDIKLLCHRSIQLNDICLLTSMAMLANEQSVVIHIMYNSVLEWEKGSPGLSEVGWQICFDKGFSEFYTLDMCFYEHTLVNHSPYPHSTSYITFHQFTPEYWFYESISLYFPCMLRYHLFLKKNVN